MAKAGTGATLDGHFGWPLHKRIEEIKKLLKEPIKAHYRVFFKSQNTDLPVIRVPIEFPKYRLENGRTSSLQAEYLARNPKVRQDIFTGDPELLDAQKAQHELLQKVVKDQDLLSTFNKPANKQIDPLILDENGFIVNGNRRACCWRDLYYADQEKFGHYAYIDVAVLPHCTEQDIDRLEAKLQIQKDIRADYSWDARANMFLDKQKRDGFSNKDLAELYEMKESEVVELLDMRRYAEAYLISRGKQNMWSLVSDHDFAFQKIVASRPKLDDVADKVIFTEAAFALIDKPDEAGGRLYEQIPAILDNIKEVKEKLAEEFPVAVPAAKDDEDPFADEKPAEVHSIPLSEQIRKPENVSTARKIIVEVIASQKELKKNIKAAEYLLDCTKKAHAALQAAVKDGLRPESKRAGVAKQLDAIDNFIASIRKYLKEHADN